MPLTAIVFIIIFIAGCFVTLFVDASYGLMFYLFEYFMTPSKSWWGKSLPNLRYSFTMGLIILISFAITSKKYSENRIFTAPQCKWLILFGTIIVLTWPVAVDNYQQQFFTTIFLKYIVLYILILKMIDTSQKFEKLIGVFLLGQIYLGWIMYQVGRTSDGRIEKMGTADASEANVVGAILVVAIPLFLHYIIIGKKWQKVLSLAGAAIVLNGLILINSRGSFIAIIASLAYYLFSVYKIPSFPKFRKMQIAAGILAGALLFFYLADPIFWDRMSTIAEEEDTEVYTGRERVDYWFKTFTILKDYPLGVGAMGYEKLSPLYLPREVLSPITKTRAVHSTFFEAMASFGYHGFAVFIIFLISNFRYSWKLKRSLIRKNMLEPCFMASAVEAAFIAHLVAAIFVNRLYSETLYWCSAFIAVYGNIYFRKLQAAEVDTASVVPVRL